MTVLERLFIFISNSRRRSIAVTADNVKGDGVIFREGIWNDTQSECSVAILIELTIAGTI